MATTLAKTTPAALVDDLAKHGWTAVPVDAGAIFAGNPYLQHPPPMTMQEMPFPSDDIVVSQVHDCAKRHLPEPTYNHSMRVYHFGYSIMTHQFPKHAKTFSPSTWALTCLLHDIGTTPENLRATLLSFEFYGAILALDLLKSLSAPRAQAEAVAEAIIRHQDLGTVGKITFLGQLIQLATIYDNMGGRPELVNVKTREEVVGRFPRLGWSRCFAATIREENGLKPWAHTTHLGEDEFPEDVEANELMKKYE